MGRRAVFLCYLCLAISCLMVLKVWWRVASQGRAAAGAINDLQPPAILVQGIPLTGMPEYKFYWIGNSTIPGAGLGVFARQHMPAGTLWNIEDAKEEHTLAICLPLWQALVGLMDYLEAAGHSNHPVHGVTAALRTFYDTYGYVCYDNHHYIVALTGNTFTNHAPQPPKDSSTQPRKSGLRAGQTSTMPQQLPGTGPDTVRYANSDAPSPDQARGLTPWQKCTISATLRDIQEGEELLENYNKYNTPCRTGCQEFLHEQTELEQSHDGSELDALNLLPTEDWNHAAAVQLLDVYVANISGRLGVFATRDLPKGTVWNKEDAVYSFAITRGQWATLLRLQESLMAAHVSKPVIFATVSAIRSHGLYCPLDDRMYIPLTYSMLARRSPPQGNNEQVRGNGSNGEDTSGTQQLANSVRAAVLGQATRFALPMGVAPAQHAASCTWMFTVADVRKGEEVIVDQSQQLNCDWPGIKPTVQQ